MYENLVVYFSRRGQNYVNGSIVELEVGNTEYVAKVLSNLIDCQLFKVETIHSYALDYTKCTEEALEEKKNDARPKILDYVHQFCKYQNVFILYPNWWETMPMAMFTFLETHQTIGKNIIPLCTHEGSGMGESVADIQKLCPKATILKPLAITGSCVQKCGPQLRNWLIELEINISEE